MEVACNNKICHRAQSKIYLRWFLTEIQSMQRHRRICANYTRGLGSHGSNQTQAEVIVHWRKYMMITWKRMECLRYMNYLQRW